MLTHLWVTWGLANLGWAHLGSFTSNYRSYQAWPLPAGPRSVPPWSLGSRLKGQQLSGSSSSHHNVKSTKEQASSHKRNSILCLPQVLTFPWVKGNVQWTAQSYWLKSVTRQSPGSRRQGKITFWTKLLNKNPAVIVERVWEALLWNRPDLTLHLFF